MILFWFFFKEACTFFNNPFSPQQNSEGHVTGWKIIHVVARTYFLESEIANISSRAEVCVCYDAQGHSPKNVDGLNNLFSLW